MGEKFNLHLDRSFRMIDSRETFLERLTCFISNDIPISSISVAVKICDETANLFKRPARNLNSLGFLGVMSIDFIE